MTVCFSHPIVDFSLDFSLQFFTKCSILIKSSVFFFVVCASADYYHSLPTEGCTYMLTVHDYFAKNKWEMYCIGIWVADTLRFMLFTKNAESCQTIFIHLWKRPTASNWTKSVVTACHPTCLLVNQSIWFSYYCSHICKMSDFKEVNILRKYLHFFWPRVEWNDWQNFVWFQMVCVCV